MSLFIFAFLHLFPFIPQRWDSSSFSLSLRVCALLCAPSLYALLSISICCSVCVAWGMNVPGRRDSCHCLCQESSRRGIRHPRIRRVNRRSGPGFLSHTHPHTHTYSLSFSFSRWFRGREPARQKQKKGPWESQPDRSPASHHADHPTAAACDLSRRRLPVTLCVRVPLHRTQTRPWSGEREAATCRNRTRDSLLGSVSFLFLLAVAFLFSPCHFCSAGIIK